MRLFVFVISLILVGADLVSSAQNSNTDTTPQEDASAQNANTTGSNMNTGGRRRRRGRRRSGNMNANTSATTDANVSAQENANTADAAQENANAATEATENTNTGGRRRRRGRRRSATTATGDTGGEMIVNKPIQVFGLGRCNPMAQEQTDLSGAYTGTVNYPEGGLTGDATLTVTGNDFTLTGGSSTIEGRIFAVTTCNYTGVTMRLGKDAPVAAGGTPPPPPTTISVRARRMGGGLTLESVPGESREFSFRSAGAGGAGTGMRRGGRRGRRQGRPNPVGIKPPTATGHDH